MTFEHFDLFEAYTEQTLTDDQRQALETRLQTDPDLRAQLRDYQQFRHSIDAVAIRQRLEHLHNRLERQGALETDSRPPALSGAVPRWRRQRVFWGMAGLGLLLAIGLYWFTRPSLSEQVFMTYYQPEPQARGAMPCGPQLLPGITAYRAGQYEQALQVFQKLPEQTCLSYYIGITQLALGRTSDAILTLEPTVQPQQGGQPENDDLLRQKSAWYLALAYLKANRPEEARRLLTVIAREPNQPFQTVAQKVLTALEHE